MSVIGFDFGTTNSLISVVSGDKVINFLDDENRPIPSVVCYEGVKKIVGRAARERLAEAGLGVHGNIVRSPKMYLGDESIYVEGVERRPVDVVSDVVKYVFSKAKESPNGAMLKGVKGAVVTIPIDMDGVRRRNLRDAFRNAELRIKQFIHEPFAALYGHFRQNGVEQMLRRYHRKPILVFDWGGGTLDLTLCKPHGNTLVQIMNDGTDEVGGDQFDETIMNYLIQKGYVKRGMKAPTIQIGAKSRLLDRCEQAKIALSSRDKTIIYVRDFFLDDSDGVFNYELEKAELEAIIKPLLDKGIRRIEKILNDADFSPQQVALCLATGGMSNMPIIKQKLYELFGAERVHIPGGTATLIAEGAAWIANDEIGLSLAKNVEVVFARNSFFPLVKGGTQMPNEGEVQKESFHLYCTDPRDGVAKFQICSPTRAGNSPLPNDPRTHLDILTVSVDAKARAFQERLELDVSINDDLILIAHARSLNVGDEDETEIHNLEFGLKFSAVENHEDSGEVVEMGTKHEHNDKGGLSVRANITDRDQDYSLVPGEYMYQLDRGYFDTRNSPPKVQVEERLYYEPCSLCGLASNDPKCRCGEMLQK